MIRSPPRSTHCISSAASDVYKRQVHGDKINQRKEKAMSKERNIQVYVSGFSRRTTRDDLKDKFREFGKIRDVKMKQGFAFIEFENYLDAQDAIEEGTKKQLEIDSRKLVIEQAGRDRKKRAGGPGPQANDECFNCGQKGHWRNECTQPRRRRPFRMNSRSSSSDNGYGHHHKKRHYKHKHSSSRSSSSSKSDVKSKSSSYDRHYRRKRSSDSESSRSRSKNRDKSKDRRRSKHSESKSPSSSNHKHSSQSHNKSQDKEKDKKDESMNKSEKENKDKSLSKSVDKSKSKESQQQKKIENGQVQI
eukprot:TRINITY_DN237_c0_g1_i6.p1 TRINITY_DN237_c0_g1~~TRINITY_DN237_c0_g1_i6.p1  ORF type:complete len:304 (-),score=74.97 TRINITY_DN237_c0_g1_i6:127-1038(-)